MASAWERLGFSYNQVAARYERTFQDELAAKPRDRDLLNEFCAAAADPVIDIGCGPGQIGVYARDRGRRVLGVDLSAEMSRRAARHLDAAVVSDMRALSFADKSAGGLLAFYSIIHLRRSELAGVLGEFHRVLRPGGRLLFSAHEGDGEIEQGEFLGAPVPFVATLFRAPELVAATSAAGLEVVRAERRAPYPSEHPTVRLYVEAVRST